MQTDELMLIDLSGLAHQIWHVSGNQPDPSFVSNQLVARVRAITSQHPHAAICLDNGKSFRKDIDPNYKAGRDTENRAVMKHQIDSACDVLRQDGFPIWSAKGYEADDLIGSAVAKTMEIPNTTVVVVSDDKDLSQLISDRVTQRKFDGSLRTPADVFDKFGVKPEQMGDLLALMGDKSDNIIGAEKIGKVIGARLLAEHGSLAALYDAMSHGVVSGVTAGMRTNLMEFKPRWPTVAKLIALRTDVPIEFSEIAAERAASPMEDAVGENWESDGHGDIASIQPREPFKQGADSNDAPLPFGRELSGSEAVSALGAATARYSAASTTTPTMGAIPLTPAQSAGFAGPVELMPARETLPALSGPVDFSQALEPRSMQEAVQLAQRMYESRLFGAYGTPQAVLATVLAGRELGIPAMASLRAFHIIEGKPQMSAGTIQSLVLKSGRAKYFRCSERTATRATFVTQRGDDPEMALTYTIEEGRAAWPKDENAWNKSGWGRNPADMLVARASSKLARLVYPDVVSGLYAPEEMD